MPLTGDFAALRTLIAGLRPAQLKRPIVLGARGVLPQLMQEAISARRAPPGNGGAWPDNARPRVQRPLTALSQTFVVEASADRLTVRSDHPGAGPLQWGAQGRPRAPAPGAKWDEEAQRYRVRGRFATGAGAAGKRQPPRRFLPVDGLPRGWQVRMLGPGRMVLRQVLRAD